MSTEDAIETVIGPFGKYQAMILILISLGRYPTEFQLNNVVFILPNVRYTCLDQNAPNSSNHCPCESPEYDQSTIMSSVTSEWDLICDRTWLASVAQSVTQVGILSGSLTYGYVSDRYGRKIAVVLALFLEVVFEMTSALVPEFWMFLICRFLIGVAIGGTILCCYIILIELSGKSFRPYLVLQEMTYATGYFILPIIAYFVRDWRQLQLATSVPWLFVTVYYWIIPESPRWLITVGRKQEAIEILTHIAKTNSRPTHNIGAIVDIIEEESMSKGRKQSSSYLDLLKYPKIRKYTIINALIWMLCSHTFYGVNQYIGRLEGNIYLNVMVSAACLAPMIVVVAFASLKFKRKVCIKTTFIVSATSLLVIIFIPRDLRPVILAFAVIGHIGAFTSFVQIYLFSTEIFPTSIRNKALGFASMFARFGGFIAPFVVNLEIEWVSIVIFSGLAFCAVFLCTFLPETKDIVLLNTIEQAEHPKVKNERVEPLLAK